MTRHSAVLFVAIVMMAITIPVLASTDGADTSQTPVTGVHRLTLRINGMACPFCAYGLEKKLSLLEGYVDNTYKVDINAGKVSFGWKPAQPLKLKKLSQTVEDAGYTLKNVTGTFVGTPAKQDDRYFLNLPKPVNQRFFLYEPKVVKKMKLSDEQLHKRTGHPSMLSSEVRKRLDQAMVQGALVRIVGSVYRHKTKGIPPLVLGVTHLERLGSPATQPRQN